MRLTMKGKSLLLSKVTASCLQMSEALMRGFIASGLVAPENMVASVRSAERWQAMEGLGVQPVGDALRGGAAEIAASCDTILIGVSSPSVCVAVSEFACACSLSMPP